MAPVLESMLVMESPGHWFASICHLALSEVQSQEPLFAWAEPLRQGGSKRAAEAAERLAAGSRRDVLASAGAVQGAGQDRRCQRQPMVVAPSPLTSLCLPICCHFVALNPAGRSKA